MFNGMGYICLMICTYFILLHTSVFSLFYMNFCNCQQWPSKDIQSNKKYKNLLVFSEKNISGWTNQCNHNLWSCTKSLKYFLLQALVKLEGLSMNILFLRHVNEKHHWDHIYIYTHIYIITLKIIPVDPLPLFTMVDKTIVQSISSKYTSVTISSTLQWRHNDHNGIWNHQHHGCLLNRLLGHRSKKTSKLRVTGLCAGNSPGPVNSPHKGPVTRKMFPFDDIIMKCSCMKKA